MKRTRRNSTTTPGAPARGRRYSFEGGDDAAMLVATLGPAAVQTAPRHLQIGDGYTAVLIITGYPPEVGLAWLDSLLAWPGRVDVVQHIEPIPAATAATRLRRQRARLESNRRLDFDKGRLGDPVTDAAAEDPADLPA